MTKRLSEQEQDEEMLDALFDDRLVKLIPDRFFDRHYVVRALDDKRLAQKDFPTYLQFEYYARKATRPTVMAGVLVGELRAELRWLQIDKERADDAVDCRLMSAIHAVLRPNVKVKIGLSKYERAQFNKLNLGEADDRFDIEIYHDMTYYLVRLNSEFVHINDVQLEQIQDGNTSCTELICALSQQWYSQFVKKHPNSRHIDVSAILADSYSLTYGLENDHLPVRASMLFYCARFLMRYDSPEEYDLQFSWIPRETLEELLQLVQKLIRQHDAREGEQNVDEE